MPQLVILGTSYAIPDEDHENTHMVLVGKQRMVLIDCTGHPTLRLEQAGVNFRQLTDIILTHFHPDHVSGVAPFLMNLWLLGREKPLHIHGLADTIDRTEQMMELYDWKTWPGFFPVEFHRLPEEELVTVLVSEEMRIQASPARHIIPTIGLRMESLASGASVVYSGDTEPCPQVVRLAQGSQVLIHEASGASFGHSSASQAGEIAQAAGASQLYLIHYPTIGLQTDRLIAAAQETFRGPVKLAVDLMQLDF
jgi:ribonuclease Z